MQIRLQKFLAEGGAGSRRYCEQLIRASRVEVNGDVVHEQGVRIDPEHDRITLDGHPVRARRKLYVALNKPRGYVCTRQAQGGQPVVANLLPREWADLYPVGRLDRESEGLLFLTNDGEFCLRLTHPRYEVPRKYWTAVEGRVEPAMLRRFEHGIDDQGERLRVLRSRLISSNDTSSVVELELKEGKNHEVRRLFGACGLQVKTLRRTQMGPIKLGELPVGRYRVLNPAEVSSLLTPREPHSRRRKEADPPH